MFRHVLLSRHGSTYGSDNGKGRRWSITLVLLKWLTMQLTQTTLVSGPFWGLYPWSQAPSWTQVSCSDFIFGGAQSLRACRSFRQRTHFKLLCLCSYLYKRTRSVFRYCLARSESIGRWPRSTLESSIAIPSPVWIWFGLAGAVPFSVLVEEGIVVYMARSLLDQVNIDKLTSPTNEGYLRSSAKLIGSAFVFLFGKLPKNDGRYWNNLLIEQRMKFWCY